MGAIPTLNRAAWQVAVFATMAKRSQSSQRWLKEHFADPYVKRAQAEGLRSRAAYKLEELIERDRLLKPGMVVVDLGAAPGGWSQYVRQAMGGQGRVVAMDILEMPSLAGVDFLHGDFREQVVLSRLEAMLEGRQGGLGGDQPLGESLLQIPHGIQHAHVAERRRCGHGTVSGAFDRVAAGAFLSHQDRAPVR